MRIRVEHSDVTALAADQAEVATTARAGMSRVVRKNVKLGERTEKTIARAASGRHGRDYFKRISSQMTSPLQGEWGPHDGGTPVGAGWRHGVNTDSEKSADIVAPAFEKDISSLIDGLFDSSGRTGR